MTRVVTLVDQPQPLGPSVAALGVFDGVHLGHQELLRTVVRRGRRLGQTSAALTFDRDPDQVVTPHAAAPQLLTLEDKLRFMSEVGLDLILVVAFTASVASLEPERFLTELVEPALGPVEVHVGADFRFGASAAGDLETLYVWAAQNGVEVTPHDLLQVDGTPVTSTRVRALVAAGDVEGATELLGRAHRVSGHVKRGRGEGTGLGVSTANVEPTPFAALPADGTYAGRANTMSGPWPAAISVGVPPTFPQAVDVLEAHLIGYTGDLYDTPLTLEFFARLRSNEEFASSEALVAAIQSDIAATVRIVEDRRESARAAAGESDVLPDGTPVVSDPDALVAAEAAAASDSLDREHSDVPAHAQWVEVSSVMDFTGLPTDQGNILGLIALQSALEDAGIPTAWDPFAPYTSTLVPYNARQWRALKLLTPDDRLEEAQAIARGLRHTHHPLSGGPMQAQPGWKRAGTVFFIIFLLSSLGGAGYALSNWLGG